MPKSKLTEREKENIGKKLGLKKIKKEEHLKQILKDNKKNRKQTERVSKNENKN